jgi:2-methylcitrate dehydratase PrpD
METIAQSLAGFASALHYDDIPTEVINEIKPHILDVLGIGLAASDLDYAHQILDTIRSWGGRPESTVIKYGDQLPVTSVVLANASFAHGLDFDDTHTESITHASACVVPTALAVSEKLRADGKSMLTAAVAGYEVMTRIGLSAPGGFHRHGYHATPICGTFAAGIIAGKLMDLPKKALTNTLGVCGSQSAGLQAFLDDGSWTKRFHAGWAAHSGVVAAQLAERGFRGPKTVIDGRYGLFASHLRTDEFDLERILLNLGDTWETSRIALKPYPVCHFNHASMDSAKALMEEHSIDLDDILEAVALVPEEIVSIVCEPIKEKQMPTTVYGALFSLPFCIGTVIVHGRAGLDHFTDTTLTDEKVLNVAKKVRYQVASWPQFPRYFSGGLKIVLRDGREFEHLEPINRGNPDNPLSQTEVRAKFEDNASRALPADSIERIFEMVDRLEKIPNVEALSSLFVTPPL